MQTDVLIAGGGIGGLLLASELSQHARVVLVEAEAQLPRRKYWLTSQRCLSTCRELACCVDREYPTLDFIAYDRTCARLQGPYLFWETDRLVSYLEQMARSGSCTFLLGQPLRTYSPFPKGITAVVGSQEIRTRLLVDCMGYASPVVAAKRTVRYVGYFVMAGQEVKLRSELAPVGLHNPLLQRHPTFLEIFPTSKGTAYAAMIAPARSLSEKTALARDLRAALAMPDYAESIETIPGSRRVFGIIPVGIPRQLALERVAFFGEAAQMNPPTSATGLTRMLHHYKDVAASLTGLLHSDTLSKRDLEAATIQPFSRLHRYFQLVLFQRLLSMSSDGFRTLVHELDRHPDEFVNDLVFAEAPFSAWPSPLLGALLTPRSHLGASLAGGLRRLLVRL